jgi:hypothetical protein
MDFLIQFGLIAKEIPSMQLEMNAPPTINLSKMWMVLIFEALNKGITMSNIAP